jgi:hypothetical protein
MRELGRATANLFFCAGGSRDQSAALNPFAPGTLAAEEWAAGWESLWEESPSFTPGPTIASRETHEQDAGRTNR